LKIGLVSPYDYSFPGGVVQHVAHLAHYYQDWGHKVKILAPCLKEGTQYFEEEVTSIGRPFPVPYGGTIARLPLSPWLPAQVRKILRKEKFDILHLHEPFIPMLCLSSLVESNSCNVGTFHAYNIKSRGYRPLKPLFKKLLKRLDSKIVVSQPLYNFLNKYVPSNYQIIPNGIDIERFTPDGPVKTEYMDGKVNIVFVGRLEKRKGLGYLIKACGILRKEHSNFRLIVVGPGTRLRPGYEELAQEVGLDNIVFAGYASDTELADYYRTADIFCAPAIGGESFGIVLLEAMACGKPVIASSIDGYASVMHDTEGGMLVPPEDEAALAESIKMIIDNRALREKIGDRGRASAQGYSWNNVALKVMGVYEEMLRGKS
jgi:phosphatidyl-myo-inositol alpha-mannosyltransferase